jgi:hypothetical protein
MRRPVSALISPVRTTPISDSCLLFERQLDIDTVPQHRLACRAPAPRDDLTGDPGSLSAQRP